MSKTVRASAKLQEMTFVDFNICYWMASLRMFYSLTLTYFSRSNFNISKSVKASTKLQEVTFIDFNIRHRIASLWMLYTLTLTYYSRSNISNVNIWKTVKASTKVQMHNICRFQYLPWNGIANVILFDLDLLFQIVACEIKYSDLLTY